MNDTLIRKIAIELTSKLPKIKKRFKFSRIELDLYDNNAIMYQLDGHNYNWFNAKASTKDGKLIETSKAKIIDVKETKNTKKDDIIITYAQNDLILKQYFTIEKDKNYFTTKIVLNDNNKTTSNYLVPLSFAYPSSLCDELFLSLEQKMLLVPYDNDMWVSYESTPLKPGRTSYDVTCLYNDHTNSGLLLGALDFDIFKNGIVSSSFDARMVDCISGIADAGTHDDLPHGYVSSQEVSSSRFICGYFDDVRTGLETYGKLAQNKKGVYEWKHGVPFGWNSYSALTLHTTLDHLKTTADFIHDEIPEFKSKDGVTYINFDAVFGIDKNAIKKEIARLHKRHQKVGVYTNPVSHLPMLDMVPLRGTPGKFRKDIVLQGHPTIDGKYPIDITLPEAELDFRLELREFVKMGYDYIKIDFLSHGAVEGTRYNKKITTGRQALMYFYNIIKDELDPKKIGKEIFISSSIDPLFPCGYSHSRRCSCDSFGHHEDVKYVLNALTYGYWTNNTLYQFNDPDHTVLYNSMVDGRTPSTFNEAKSRYNASIISGTVMLLSDNYGPTGDKKIIKNSIERAKKLCRNKKLNEIAQLNKAFKPITLQHTSNVYYLNDKKKYFALFNFEEDNQTFTINPKDICFPNRGKLLNLNTNEITTYQDKIVISLDNYDSNIYQIIK